MGKLFKIGAAVPEGYGLLAAAMFFGLERPAPPESICPKPGDLLVSKAELVEKQILEKRGDFLYGELVVLPGAGGPWPHYHQGFVEKFEGDQGHPDGFMDSGRGAPPLQLALSFGYCDTHVGPPAVEKVLWAALGPIAWLSGLKSYYPEYAPRPAPVRNDVSAAAAH